MVEFEGFKKVLIFKISFGLNLINKESAKSYVFVFFTLRDLINGKSEGKWTWCVPDYLMRSIRFKWLYTIIDIWFLRLRILYMFIYYYFILNDIHKAVLGLKTLDNSSWDSLFSIKEFWNDSEHFEFYSFWTFLSPSKSIFKYNI